MHIIKLCVGVSSVEDLEDWRARYAAQHRGRDDGLVVHRTRMMPRRAADIVGQGSLYWVIAGAVRCRQTIAGLEETSDQEGRKCCDILLDPQIIRTRPWPRRPFQGWRYLELKDAPPDLSGPQPPSDEMARELAEMGLL